MGNIRQRVAALEGVGGHSSLGALLDALDDPVAFSHVQVSPALAGALDALEPVERSVAVSRYSDLPL